MCRSAKVPKNKVKVHLRLSSKISGSCLLKCSSETFQKLPYFWITKIRIVFRLLNIWTSNLSLITLPLAQPTWRSIQERGCIGVDYVISTFNIIFGLTSYTRSSQKKQFLIFGAMKNIFFLVLLINQLFSYYLG